MLDIEYYLPDIDESLLSDSLLEWSPATVVDHSTDVTTTTMTIATLFILDGLLKHAVHLISVLQHTQELTFTALYTYNTDEDTLTPW